MMTNRDAGLKIIERNEFSRIVEDILNKTQNHGEQVQLCLNHLQNSKDELRKQDRNRKLLDFIQSHNMYKNWTRKLRSKLDTGFDILNNWKHFFFSYTTRGCTSINYLFSELIEDYKKQWRRDWLKDQTRHHLAYIIHEKMNNHNLSSFFDNNDISSGQRIEVDIQKACESAFAFVQIIEESSFVNHSEKNQDDIDRDGKNWCHMEYNFFKQNNERLVKLVEVDHLTDGMHFIVLSKNVDEILPVNLNGYMEWVENIKKLKHTNLYEEKCEGDLKIKLKDSIARNVIQRRKEIIEALLNN